MKKYATKSKEVYRKKTYKKSPAKYRKRYNKNTPSTSKTGKVMKDRTFTKLEFVSLTVGVTRQTAGQYVTSNGSGMIPFASPSTSNPQIQQYVFCPTFYGQEAGATEAPSFGQTGKLLQGNDLQLFQEGGFVGVTSQYSDYYKQLYPTGISQWWPFYSQCLVHGSAVEVTLTDCTQSGQLVVIPIPTNNNFFRGSEDYDTFMAGSNIRQLLSFKAIPEEQPYARIKFVSKSGGMDKVTIKHKMLTKKLYNKADLRDDEEAFIRLEGLGPNYDNESLQDSNYDASEIDKWVWYIAFIPVGTDKTTDDTIHCNVQVKITYFCEFADRKTLEYATADTGLPGL